MEPRTISRTPLNPHFTLSPDQEKLLLAALYSNTAVPAIYNSNSNSNNNSNSNSNSNNNINNDNNRNTTNPNPNSTSTPTSTVDSLSMAPSSLRSPLESALEPTPGSATMNGFEESPFIDYDYEFDADGLDFDFTNDPLAQGQMIGNLPGTSSDGDQEATPEKRSHPGDEEDAGGGKRRESEEKASKKPGRKPLTSEPTSKRKAQNRAAQRAFRERKEKHLRDLETKVDDLQKASESANHENSILRAQIEKLTSELREYKKRLSLASAASRPLGAAYSQNMAGRGSGVSSVNDVNFQFEFPRFGRLPRPAGFKTLGVQSPVSPQTGNQLPKTTSNDRESAAAKATANPHSNNNGNATHKTNGVNKTSIGLDQTISQAEVTDMSTFSGLFSPSLLESVSKSQSPFDFLTNKESYTSRSSMDSGSGSGTGHASTSHSSPSASSNSVHGTSSSCGTSPEPVSQSPSYSKPSENTLSTIGEEHGKCPSGSSPGEISFCQKLNEACGNPHNPIPRTLSASRSANSSSNANNHPTDPLLSTPKIDFHGIDFFAAQNGNQFDPQLYGDYREPQDNILANGGPFGDSFFSEAYPFNGPDFTSPYNAASTPKKDLVSQIDQAQSADDDVEVVPGEDPSKMLTCNTIWDRLQACPKLKEGEFDLDGLCKDLQKKAKCSETGAVVNESDFHEVLETYVGHKVDSKSLEEMVKNG